MTKIRPPKVDFPGNLEVLIYEGYLANGVGKSQANSKFD
jgi:hypothetical protein